MYMECVSVCVCIFVFSSERCWAMAARSAKGIHLESVREYLCVCRVCGVWQINCTTFV